MSRTRELTVRAQGELEVVMTRSFDAPRQLVFDAHTKPELVRRWLLGPDGWTMPICEMDVRVGGRYRWVWRRERDGHEMATAGSFHEVVPPERLVFTEQFEQAWYDGEGFNTIELAEEGGRTTMTYTMRYASRETRDGVLASGMETGVGRSYERLDAIFAAA